MSKSSTEVTAVTTESSPEKVSKVNRISADGITLEWLEKEYGTVSDRIRYLNAKGYTRSEIAKFLGKIYQHVRNVLENDAIRAQSKK